MLFVIIPFYDPVGVNLFLCEAATETNLPLSVSTCSKC